MISDYKGDEIKEGVLVAYNQSGNVVLGMVDRVVTEPIPWRYDGPSGRAVHARAGRIDIKNQKSGKISKVKWQSSICVIPTK